MSREDIERIWGAHLEGEFETQDLEATPATMIEDASVLHVPVGTGGRGKSELRRFYGEDFIDSSPADLVTTSVSRTVGDSSLADERHMVSTHSNRMEWLLPGLEPTGRQVVRDVMAVIQFRDGLLASERIYRDHAGVLRQVGLL